MTQHKAKRIHAAGKRQHTVAGRSVQVAWSFIWMWHRAEKVTETLIVKANRIFPYPYRSLVRKRKLSNPAKLLGFQSFCFSDPRPWSWILSNDGKSDLNLEYKGQRWDFCEEVTALHFTTSCAAVKFVKREGWATSTLNREIPATIIRPSDLNVPGRID